jgi:hypothetical protein
MAVEDRKIAIATRKARDPETSRPELVDSVCFTVSHRRASSQSRPGFWDQCGTTCYVLRVLRRQRQ